MVRLEPSLHDHLLRILSNESVSASNFFHDLFVKELKRRGLLDDDTVIKLVGTAR